MELIVCRHAATKPYYRLQRIARHLKNDDKATVAVIIAFLYTEILLNFGRSDISVDPRLSPQGLHLRWGMGSVKGNDLNSTHAWNK